MLSIDKHLPGKDGAHGNLSRPSPGDARHVGRERNIVPRGPAILTPQQFNAVLTAFEKVREENAIVLDEDAQDILSQRGRFPVWRLGARLNGYVPSVRQDCQCDDCERDRYKLTVKMSGRCSGHGVKRR